MRKTLNYGLKFGIVLTIIFSIYSCSSDSSNPVTVTYDANSINGTITFADTNFISDTTNGSYYVAAFATWPGPPSALTKIVPVKANGKFTASYKIIVSQNGNYVVSTAWVKKSPYASLILGVYDVAGKDTSRVSLLGPHPTANITEGKGIGDINYNSYIDTTFKLAKF